MVLLCLCGWVNVVFAVDTYAYLYCKYENGRNLRNNATTRLRRSARTFDRHLIKSVYDPTLKLSQVGNNSSVHMRKKRLVIPIAEPRTTATPTSSEQVSEHAVCPFDTVLDINIIRIPRQMMKAVCRSSFENKCQFPRVYSANHDINHQMQLQSECVIFTLQIPVKFECCERGYYRLRDEILDWPVACVCKRQQVD